MMRESFQNRELGQWGALLLILLLAFALRLRCLDCQSIWYDEGLSIYYAQRGWIELFQGVAQSDHPPLHPLLLRLWIGACGDSTFSVRLLSTWWNVLAVAAIYRLGRRLFDLMVGGIGALLLAVSPFAIWFSQETRGYTLALALALFVADSALSLFPRTFAVHSTMSEPHWTKYVLYALLAAALVYAHFYGGFVLLALNIAFMIWWWAPAGPRRPRCLIGWAAAQVAALALIAPWMPLAIKQLGQNATYWHGAVYWQEIVGQTLTAFSVGETLHGVWAVNATWALVVLVLLGTLSLSWERRNHLAMALTWLWIAVPALALIILTLNYPKFAPRYLMNALPAFLLLAALGARWLARLARRHSASLLGWLAWTVLLVPTLIMTGATVRSLNNHYADETLYRPDVRAVSRYINAHATDQDVIVLLGGYIYPAFVYYYDGPLPVIPLPDKLLPTTQEPIEPAMLHVLNEAIVGRKQLWLVLWQPFVSDPTGLVTDTLEQTYHRLGVGRTFHDMALMCFDVSSGPLLVESPRVAQTADFSLQSSSQIRLLGYDLPVRQARPGETVYLYLYWTALTSMQHDYKVFVQILDEQGNMIAQRDQIAGAAEYPTSHWQPGKVIRNRFLLTIAPQAAAASYRLISGFYDPGPSTRLSASGEGAFADYVLLAEIEIDK